MSTINKEIKALETTLADLERIMRRLSRTGQAHSGGKLYELHSLMLQAHVIALHSLPSGLVRETAGARSRREDIECLIEDLEIELESTDPALGVFADIRLELEAARYELGLLTDL